MNEQTIRRIIEMEQRFDTLLRHSPGAVRKDPVLTRMRADLTAYYENGQWLADYTLDELGMLPPDLKRGVLSQDGLYDLLCRLDSCEDAP